MKNQLNIRQPRRYTDSAAVYTEMKGEVIPTLNPEVPDPPPKPPKPPRRAPPKERTENPPITSSADSDTGDPTTDNPLSIKKSIKVAPNVEIPIHIPVAQPKETGGVKRSPRGRGRPPVATRTELRKIAPAPPTPVLIKTVKPVLQPGQSMMETVLNDPSIQELLKQNPGHTLTVVRVPEDAHLSQVQVESLAGAGRLIGEQQTVQVTLTNQNNATAGRTPGKLGKKRKRRRPEEFEEELPAEEEKELKVTRSGRISRPPAHQRRYYVGSRLKSLGNSEPTSEESVPTEVVEGAAGEPGGASGDPGGEGAQQDGTTTTTTEQDGTTGTTTTNAINKSVKKGRGRPRKNPLPARPINWDPVPRNKVTRVARDVSPWDFMLMRTVVKHKNRPWKSFYNELLQEFRTLLTEMRRLSNSLLEDAPESSESTDEGKVAVDLSDADLVNTLEMSRALYQAGVPTQDLLPKRILNWLGEDASVFPKNEPDTDAEPTIVVVPEEDTSETGLSDKEPGPTVGAEESGPVDGVEEPVPAEVPKGPEPTEEPKEPGGIEGGKEPLTMDVVGEQAVGALTEQAEKPVTMTTDNTQPTSEPLVEETTEVQGSLIPPGSVLMKMDNGTFMAQTPSGAAMEIRAPSNMTIEALGALLGQAAGAQEEGVP